MQIFQLLKRRKYVFLLFVSAIIGALALFLEFYLPTKLLAYPAQTNYDIILSILPFVKNAYLMWFYIIGYVVFLSLVVISTAIKEPARLPYMLFVLSIGTLVRDILFSTTILELVPAPENLIVPSVQFSRDLFPSGHVGLFFLAGLLMRGKLLKHFLFAMSVVMAAIVLLTRTHYSIDVFGAYFIFYAIYKFCNKFEGFFTKFKV